MPSSAVAAPLPTRFAPQLVTLGHAPPAAPEEWVWEIKYDGYRMLARVDGTSIRLFTRNGHDWTSDLECLRRSLARVCLPSGFYDGEIVVLNDRGLPDFGLLQQSIDARKSEWITYYLFDCPYLFGRDLRAAALDERRQLLEQALPKVGQRVVQFSAELAGDPADMLRAACDLGLEGIVGKRRDAPYVSRRSHAWIKLKCGLVDEFVIVGYTRARAGVGSLLLAMPTGAGGLRYVGSVSSGLSEGQRRELLAAFGHIGTTAPAVVGPITHSPNVQWIRPLLNARVAFTEWTHAGAVRHPVIKRYWIAVQ
jgi:bifunctional non-homologous end joining protein LigD